MGSGENLHCKHPAAMSWRNTRWKAATWNWKATTWERAKWHKTRAASPSRIIVACSNCGLLKCKWSFVAAATIVINVEQPNVLGDVCRPQPNLPVTLTGKERAASEIIYTKDVALSKPDLYILSLSNHTMSQISEQTPSPTLDFKIHQCRLNQIRKTTYRNKLCLTSTQSHTTLRV